MQKPARLELICLWADFDAVCNVFQKGLPFQICNSIRISVARWRHNFHQITDENYEKSAEKFVRTTSYR